MNSLLKFKPLLLVLSTVILISGCIIKNEADPTVSPDTIISETAAQSTQTAQTTQAIDSQKEVVSTVFSGIKDYQIDNPKTYYNEEFKFSVDYPTAWKVQCADGEMVPPHPDGSPDGGIIIYVDSNKNNWMYILGGRGHMDTDWDGFTLRSETITTTDGVNGKFSYMSIEGNIVISLVLEDASHGANITMSETSFKKHKAQVYGILKSIKISK